MKLRLERSEYFWAGLERRVDWYRDHAGIALAAVHGMHFLLTWNCTRIANAEMAVAIACVCRKHGFTAPVICTPEELMGG